MTFGQLVNNSFSSLNLFSFDPLSGSWYDVVSDCYVIARLDFRLAFLMRSLILGLAFVA
jgi:hypothetical protein